MLFLISRRGTRTAYFSIAVLDKLLSLYIRVLNFPDDVITSLAVGDINLFEAAQLARLTPERLDVSPARARARRNELLKSHLLAQGSEVRLRLSVNELIGKKTTSAASGQAGDLGIGVADDLIELDPYDTRHLFWEELRRIAFALRSVTKKALNAPPLAVGMDEPA